MNTIIHSYRSNFALNTIAPDADWKGTPVDKNGNYLNLYHPFQPSFTDVLRWQFQKNPFKKEKKAEYVQNQSLVDTEWLHSKEDVMVRLCHTCFYIRINGVTILTDPVFGDVFGTKRVCPFPMDPALLKNIDYILLSHDHRDHMDEKSLKIVSANNPDAIYLAGLSSEKIIRRFTHSTRIETAGWYQQYITDKSRINITFIPSRHWSKRGALDTNTRLWGGFVLEAKGKCILFGGDSGYDLHYKQLANVFGTIDYALLGIGAYEPVWFMHANHQSPKEALQAFKDLRAQYFFPMHYGTFDLSDEPIGMPLKELLKEAEQTGERKRIITSSIIYPGKMH